MADGAGDECLEGGSFGVSKTDVFDTDAGIVVLPALSEHTYWGRDPHIGKSSVGENKMIDLATLGDLYLGGEPGEDLTSAGPACALLTSAIGN